MSDYLAKPTLTFPFPLSKRQWWVLGIVFISYSTVMFFSTTFVPTPSLLFPAEAIAIAALFLEGLWLWPIIVVASFVGGLVAHVSPISLSLLPLADALQALVAAYLLKKVKVDPLFRRAYDIFWLFGIIFAVSIIVPTVRTISYAFTTTLSEVPVPAISWGAQYTANVFCLLIFLPFLLRWLSKVRFRRSIPEIAELFLIFALLTWIDYSVFIAGIVALGPIPMVYILLFPLFWIALRLRPRFVTLALVITSLFGIASLFERDTVTPTVFSAHLFEMQVFLSSLAFIFFIIASLEESRRLSANLLRMQVATLENAVTRVSQEAKAKNDFIAVLAHELRNPLAPIASAIDLLRLTPDRKKDEMETLEMMEDRMHSIRRILDDLLDVSRITEGKITLRKEAVDLKTTIRNAVVSTEHHFTERHQPLTANVPGKPVVVTGDRVRLEQIICNLLTNASKYSDPGDRVFLKLTTDADYATLQVQDEGLGIASENLEEIFVPFHQIDNGARSRRGIGIGLSLVRNFVELHGGTVKAESKGPGHGSILTVVLPLSSDQHSAVVGRAMPSLKSQKRSADVGPTVLVVDDNDAAAWGIGKLLEVRGCVVDYAYSAQQAIECAIRLSPDVILLDLGLPDLDGYATAKTMRARGYRGKLVALTGWSGEESRLKVRESGFEGYIVKPAGLADLKRVIPEIA